MLRNTFSYKMVSQRDMTARAIKKLRSHEDEESSFYLILSPNYINSLILINYMAWPSH